MPERSLPSFFPRLSRLLRAPMVFDVAHPVLTGDCPVSYRIVVAALASRSGLFRAEAPTGAPQARRNEKPMPIPNRQPLKPQSLRQAAPPALSDGPLLKNATRPILRSKRFPSPR